jgi:hypothetical protein
MNYDRPAKCERQDQRVAGRSANHRISYYVRGLSAWQHVHTGSSKWSIWPDRGREAAASARLDSLLTAGYRFVEGGDAVPAGGGSDDFTPAPYR